VFFGHEFSSLRLVLLVFFIAWVPALYYVARRFVSPGAAAVLVFLCVVWSVPNYTASMPSWYNLFLATFAAAATLRFVETNQRIYLFLAGVSCGVSMTVKITGVYALAATVLALVYFEQEHTSSSTAARRWSWFTVGLVVIAACVVVGLAGLVSQAFALPEILDFVVPGLALSTFLIRNEFQRARGNTSQRFKLLGSLVWPVLVGAALPILALSVPYLAAGEVDDLLIGVLVEPTARLESAAGPPPGLGSLLRAALVAVPVGALAFGVHRGRKAAAIGLVAVLLVFLGLAAVNDWIRLDVWLVVRWLGRIGVPVAIVALMLHSDSRRARSERVGLFILLAFAAWTALVQYPFADPIYFSYMVPFVFLTVAAFERWRVSAGGHPFSFRIVRIVVVFLAAFGVLSLNLRGLSGASANTALGLPRAGSVHVTSAQAPGYRRLVHLIDAHGVGRPIYAGPDAPEIYFLAGRANPTPYMFDFLADPGERRQRIERVLLDPRVAVAVINTDPGFSPPLDRRLVSLAERRFPRSERVAGFDVRWRE